MVNQFPQVALGFLLMKQLEALCPGPTSQTQMVGWKADCSWHFFLESCKIRSGEECWDADMSPFTGDTGWFQGSGLLTTLDLNCKWGPCIGSLSFHHHAISSLWNPKITRECNEYDSLSVPLYQRRPGQSLYPIIRQSWGSMLIASAGREVLCRAKRPCSWCPLFLLINVVMFYFPWSVLSYAKQGTFLVRMVLFFSLHPQAFCLLYLSFVEVKETVNTERNHIIEMLWLQPIETMLEDVLFYTFTLWNFVWKI